MVAHDVATFGSRSGMLHIGMAGEDVRFRNGYFPDFSRPKKRTPHLSRVEDIAMRTVIDVETDRLLPCDHKEETWRLSTSVGEVVVTTLSWKILACK